MDEKLKKLLELIKANPELPIIPMVDTEVVQSDGFQNWRGSWGDAEIREFVGYQMYGDCESIIYREDIDDIIEDISSNSDACEEEAEEIANKLEWVKAIIVAINLPE